MDNLNFLLYEIGGMPVIAWAVLAFLALLLILKLAGKKEDREEYPYQDNHSSLSQPEPAPPSGEGETLEPEVIPASTMPSSQKVKPSSSGGSFGLIAYTISIVFLVIFMSLLFFTFSPYTISKKTGEQSSSPSSYGDYDYEYNPMDFVPAGDLVSKGSDNQVILLDTEIIFNVANPFWTSTEIYIPSGSNLEITAKGKYIWDPAACNYPVGPEGASWLASTVSGSNQFLFQNQPIACLIGKVGKYIFPIGRSASVLINKPGRLELSINERWTHESNWFDNSGQIIVNIVLIS